MGLLSFFKSEKDRSDDQRGLTLLKAVRAEMPTAADEDVKIIAAIAGLLGQVAYADRPYLPAEEDRIRNELGKVQGLGEKGAEAVCRTLRSSIATVAEIEAHEYAKFLRDLADRDLLLHLLDLLLDVAAADDNVSLVEVNLIRRLTDNLGLTQADYNTSQARYREKLSGLSNKPPAASS
jgi:uncharacterized tellurite resistance protein B-like protein